MSVNNLTYSIQRYTKKPITLRAPYNSITPRYGLFVEYLDEITTEEIEENFKKAVERYTERLKENRQSFYGGVSSTNVEPFTKEMVPYPEIKKLFYELVDKEARGRREMKEDLDWYFDILDKALEYGTYREDLLSNKLSYNLLIHRDNIKDLFSSLKKLVSSILALDLLLFLYALDLPVFACEHYINAIRYLYTPRIQFNKETLITVLDKEKRYDSRVVLLMLPRGVMKTTMFIAGRAAWLYFHHLYFDKWAPRIAIGHSNEDKAKDNLVLVKQFMDKDRIRDLYGSLLDTIKNSAQKLAFSIEEEINRKEPHFQILSPKHQIAGRHHTYLLIDDLVDIDNSSTMQKCQQIKEFYRSLLPLDDNQLPGGMRIELVGTPYSNRSLYEDLKKNQNVKKYIVPAFTGGEGVETLDVEEVPDGVDVQFPHLLDWNKLRDIRDVMDDDAFFASQYLMEPYALEGMEVDFGELPEWKEPENVVFRAILVDPAISSANKKSEAVVLYVEIDDEKNIYVKWGWSHYGPSVFDLSYVILQKAHEVKPNVIIVEKIAYQESLIQVLQEEMEKRKVYYSILPHAHRQNKKLHYKMFLEPLFMQKKIFISPYVYKLKQQLEGKDSKDDYVDTLSFLSSLNLNDIVKSYAAQKETKQEESYDYRYEDDRKRALFSWNRMHRYGRW